MKTENNKIDKFISTRTEADYDWTPNTDYSRLVEEEIEEHSQIELTEDLKLGGIHAQKAWGYWFKYLTNNIWKTSFTAEILNVSDGIQNPRSLSLGCGHGGIELETAKLLKPGYQMLALDLNPEIFTQARADVEANNLNIEFMAVDLNFFEIEEKSFDVIFAHASLHHLLNLEHVFKQIYHGLKDEGRLIILDIIGKTQVLFWKPNVDYAIDLVQKMPPKYSAGISLPPYSEPSVQISMEGVRQEEIEPVMSDYFTPVKEFKYGSFIRMICTHPQLGIRFDPDIEEDRQYLQSIFDLDLSQIKDGKLRPTEIFGIYKKKDSIDLDAIDSKARARIKDVLESGQIAQNDAI